MKQYSLYFFLVFSVATPMTTLHGQDSMSHKGVVWRGFEHLWSYNHRVNRIGSFVEKANKGISIAHASATGIGPDSTYFTGYYSVVNSPESEFYYGEYTLSLDAREGNLASETFEISIPATELMKTGELEVLLNGFDLKARKRADKLQLFRISVSEVKYASAIREVRFKLRASLVTDCDSPECPKFNQKSMYTLKVYYLLVAAPKNKMHTINRLEQKDYSWDNSSELRYVPSLDFLKGNTQISYPSAALGIKSMEIMLDDDHWLTNWQQVIEPLDYNIEDGIMQYNSKLFFKTWDMEMKRYSVNPQKSKFAFRKSGWSVMGMEVVLLQFQNADILHEKRTGSLYWSGKNALPDAQEAISKFTVCPAR